MMTLKLYFDANYFSYKYKIIKFLTLLKIYFRGWKEMNKKFKSVYNEWCIGFDENMDKAVEKIKKMDKKEKECGRIE